VALYLEVHICHWLALLHRQSPKQFSKFCSLEEVNLINQLTNILFGFSLEMLDKLEAPNIPESYGISVGYAILLDITRSIGGVIQRTPDMVQLKFILH